MGRHPGFGYTRGRTAIVSSRIVRVGLTCLTAVAAALSASLSFAITQGERQSLIDLYSSTGGSNWINHAGWLGASGTECNWYGVVCAGGHVAMLTLSSNNLAGTLSGIGGLTELQNLYLADNHLSGPLPDFTSLTKLTGLYVRGNLLSGPFPSWGANVPLVAIDAGDNAFTGPIPVLSGTPTLASVKLDGNWFSGSIPDISNLAKLVYFQADGNQLTGAIPSLGGLAFLQTFSVSRNALSGVLPTMAGASVLHIIDVSNNQLTGSLPVSYPPSLHKFLASNNQLSGAMPSLASSQLQIVRVDGNAQLTGQVASVPNTLQLAGQSTLCPSALTSSNDSQTNTKWDAATGHAPWDYGGACAQQPVNALPDLRVRKTHAGNFSQGQQGATYSLTVRNDGARDTAGPVTVSDNLPAAFTATAIDGGPGWTCTHTPATASCTTSDVLAAGDSFPDITLTVDVALGAPASVINTATVTGGGEANTSNNTAADLTTIDGSGATADLTLTKNHVGNFMQGQTGAAYALTANNVGGSPTNGVVTVTDTLPAELVASQMSGQGWNCNVFIVSCTRSDPLPAGASYQPIDLKVDVAPNAQSSVLNTAQVSGGGETNLGNDSATDPTTIGIAVPDMVLSKVHVGNFYQGQTGVAYDLVVQNIGSAPSSGVINVSDTLPAAFSLTNASGAGWSCAGTTCSRNDPLPAGASYPSITLTVDVAADAPPSVVNTASVSGGGEINTTNDQASDPTTIVGVTPAADLVLAKSHAGNFTQGQSGATYSIVVFNASNVSTSGLVSVADALPAAFTPTAMGGTGWICSLATRSCSRSDPLPANSSYPAIVLTVDVAPDAPSNVVNSATVSGGGEANTANDTATDPTNIDSASAGPDLTITKTHAGNFTQGQVGATYSLTVHNIGGAASSGVVTVTDTLPQLPMSLTATAMEGPGWSCSVATKTCTRTDPVGAGSSYPAITLTVDVASFASASVINTATVAGGGEANIANDTTSDITTIDVPGAGPDLTLTKSHAGNFVRGQTGAAYSLVVHNTGTGATNGTVTVSDSLPDALLGGTIAMSGPGWNCAAPATTCTRADALPAGQSYPAITLWVDVAPNAPSSVLNTATASGGGETDTNNDAAIDPTTVGTTSISAAQTIAFTSTAPNDATVAGSTYHATATATSGLPVLLTIDGTSATVCAISGDIVSFIGPGSCTIDANQGGNGDFAPAPQQQQAFEVADAGGPHSQAITFTSAPPANAFVNGPGYVPIATSTSGLAVVLTIDGTSATVCTIANGMVGFVGPGPCTIDANQGGDADWAPAPQKQQTFMVGGAGGAGLQSIAFTSTAPADAVVNGAGYLAAATASSDLPVLLTIDSVSATVCTINSNDLVSFIGPGSCTIDANQGGDANFAPAPQAQQAFAVASAGGTQSQAITFTSTPPADAMVGGSSYLATATADSNLPVVLTIDGPSATVCTINDGTVNFIGAGACVIDANQGGDADFAPAPQAQQLFTVAGAGGTDSQSILFTSVAPAAATVGGPGYLATAAASSNLPVVLTIDAASAIVCTISNDTVNFIGSGSCMVNADQGGDAQYAPAPQAHQTFPVAPAGGTDTQTISFVSVAPTDAAIDGPTYLAIATATSTLPVVLTIDVTSAGVCTINNGTVSFIGQGTCTIDANQGGDADFAPAPQMQQMVNVGLPAGDLIFRDGFDNP